MSLYNDPHYRTENSLRSNMNADRRHSSKDSMSLPVLPHTDKARGRAARSLLTSVTSLEFGGNAHPFMSGDMRSPRRKISYSSINNMTAQSLANIVATAIPSSYSRNNRHQNPSQPSYYHNAVVRMTVEGLLIYRPKDQSTFLGVETAAAIKRPTTRQRYSSNGRVGRNVSRDRTPRYHRNEGNDDLPSSVVPFLGTIPWDMIDEVLEEPIGTPITGEKYVASSASGQQHCIPQYSPTRLILTFSTSATPSEWGPHHDALLFLMSGVVLDVQTATLSEALIEGIKLMSANDFGDRADVCREMQICPDWNTQRDVSHHSPSRGKGSRDRYSYSNKSLTDDLLLPTTNVRTASQRPAPGDGVGEMSIADLERAQRHTAHQSERQRVLEEEILRIRAREHAMREDIQLGGANWSSSSMGRGPTVTGRDGAVGTPPRSSPQRDDRVRSRSKTNFISPNPHQREIDERECGIDTQGRSADLFCHSYDAGTAIMQRSTDGVTEGATGSAHPRGASEFTSVTKSASRGGAVIDPPTPISKNRAESSSYNTSNNFLRGNDLAERIRREMREDSIKRDAAMLGSCNISPVITPTGNVAYGYKDRTESRDICSDLGDLIRQLEREEKEAEKGLRQQRNRLHLPSSNQYKSLNIVMEEETRTRFSTIPSTTSMTTVAIHPVIAPTSIVNQSYQSSQVVTPHPQPGDNGIIEVSQESKSPWVTMVHTDGRNYYYNKVTRARTWKREETDLFNNASLTINNNVTEEVKDMPAAPLPMKKAPPPPPPTKKGPALPIPTASPATPVADEEKDMPAAPLPMKKTPPPPPPTKKGPALPIPTASPAAPTSPITAEAASSGSPGTESDGVRSLSPESRSGGGKIYGMWKEFFNKENKRYYYRHITTKEATYKIPPEVAALKDAEEKSGADGNVMSPSLSPRSNSPGAGGLVVGPDGLREIPPWKEKKDPKSGRLYYVNTQTKARTWKVAETPFAGL